MIKYKANTGFVEDDRCSEGEAIYDAVYRHLQFTGEIPKEISIVKTEIFKTPTMYFDVDFIVKMKGEIDAKSEHIKQNLLNWIEMMQGDDA